MKRILLLVGINICFVCCTIKNKKPEEICQNIYDKYNNEKIQKKLLRDAIITSIKFSYDSMPDSFSFINCLSDTITFKDYILNKKALVLYAGTSFCSSCIQEELSTLNRLANRLKQKIILVLVQNMNLRELIIEKKRNEYEFDIGIIINPENTDLQIIKSDVPVYFTINNKMLLSEIFVPFKNMNGFSEEYYQFYKNGDPTPHIFVTTQVIFLT